MRPTFMGFETAKSAIFTNQKSIDIMGNNLANLDTAGYTRQRVERTAIGPSSLSSRVAGNRTGLMGSGVETQGVSQMRDTFLDKRFRDEYAKANYHGQASSLLSDIQSALGDGHDITDESGLYGAIQEIYSSLEDFIQNPTMDTEANIVMSSFKNMTQVLQQMDAKLSNVAAQHTSDLSVSVARVNDIAAQIAHLNEMIGDDATVLTNSNNQYFRPNELMDQRNLLLDELAGYGDVSTKELANGKVNVTMGGHLMIEENRYNTLNMLQNSDKTVSVQWRSIGKDVSLSGGSLLASLDFLNGRGSNVQSNKETPSQGVPYYRDQIDTFANALATMVNGTIPILDTTTGKPQLDPNGKIMYKTLLSSNVKNGMGNAVSVTAENIAISDEWKNNGASYFIYDKNNRVDDYAHKIATQLTESSYTFDAYGEKFVGTFADYEVNFLGKLGSDIKFHEGRQEASALVADDFLDRRDQISGVSKDEETTDMLRYQKSYEAASRVMTVLDDLLDVVINRMGRAGL